MQDIQNDIHSMWACTVLLDKCQNDLSLQFFHATCHLFSAHCLLSYKLLTFLDSVVSPFPFQMEVDQVKLRSQIPIAGLALCHQHSSALFMDTFW